MESTDKLRKFITEQFVTNGWSYREGMAIADEIEREIAERYMERPRDMDGIPIKVGDELSHDGFTRNFIVHSYELKDGTWFTWDVANGAMHICQACHHVKPRTIEDVLTDFAYKVCDTSNIADTEIQKYADELRSMGVGE